MESQTQAQPEEGSQTSWRNRIDPTEEAFPGRPSLDNDSEDFAALVQVSPAHLTTPLPRQPLTHVAFDVFFNTLQCFNLQQQQDLFARAILNNIMMSIHPCPPRRRGSASRLP